MNEFTIVPEWPGGYSSKWQPAHQSVERGEVVAIPLNGRTRNSLEKTFHYYSKKRGYRIEAAVQNGTLYIRRKPEAAQ